MSKEIADGLAHDLKLVTCPKVTCLERGNRTSCYLDGQSRCRFFGIPIRTIDEKSVRVQVRGGDLTI